MIVPILLAISGVTTQSIGYVLQKIGMTEFKSLKQFTSQKNFPKWLIGTVMTFIGATVFLLTTPLSNISVIQPIVGIGPAIVAIFGYFVLKTHLDKMEAMGIILTIIGIIFLSINLSSKPSTLEIEELEFFYITVILFALIFFLTLVLMQLNMFDLGIEEGIIAGLFGGFSTIYAKLGFGYLYSLNLHWTLFVLINTQTIAFILFQRALVGKGKVAKVVSVYTGMSILAPVLLGIFFFGESLSSINILGILFILIGSLVLTKQYSELIVN